MFHVKHFNIMGFVRLPEMATTDGTKKWSECSDSFADNFSATEYTYSSGWNELINNIGLVVYALNLSTWIKPFGPSYTYNDEFTILELSTGAKIKMHQATHNSNYGSDEISFKLFDKNNNELSAFNTGWTTNFGNDTLPFEHAYLFIVSNGTYCKLCFAYKYSHPNISWARLNTNSSYRVNQSVYDSWAEGSEPVLYSWKPFEQLSGNNGQFLMNLSTINASIIGDGGTQTGTDDISKLYLNPVTSLYNLTVNMLDETETVIAYCGRNYLTLERETIEDTGTIYIKVTIRLYFMSDVLVYQASPIAFNINDSKKWYLSIIYDDEAQAAALDLIQDRGAASEPRYYYNNFALPAEQDLYEIWVWLQDNGNEQEYLTPYDTGTTDNGGDPDLPRPQDHIGKPTLPTTGGLDRGIITLYRPTAEQLSSISDFLWSDNVLDNFKKYFNNFADNILSLYSLPFKPANLPTKTFKVGKMTSEITNVEYCTVRFFEIDMGEVVLRKKWGSYLDYAPYTKIEIYLPALGLHSLDSDELMSPADMYGNMPSEQGTVLKLTYNLDILTGVVVALLSVRVKKGNTYTDEVRYQFSGKIGHDVPLTGQIFANRISSIVQATAGLVGTIASGGLTAPITVPAAVTATVQAQKANVLRIGNISADASAMCTEVPYITITSPNKALLENQEDFTGFPSYKYGTLQNFTGFTQVLDAHVEGISCTEEERSLILTMLKEGVLI